jgi:Legume lectin domain
MKTRNVRAFVFACLALLLAAIAAPDALAQISIPAGGFTATTVETNGDAVVTGGVLQLTPNTTGQAGSAWFATQQPVASPFSTTFTFKLSNPSAGSEGNADGIAFVIQNSALTALGPDGCGIGFGDSAYCTSSTGGIPNSLAVEFNTFENPNVDTSNNDVTIQSCPVTEANPTGANSVDPTCTIKVNNSLPITLADGNVHTVTITYSGSSTTLLDVLVDNNDLFPGGVIFNLANIGLNAGNAWVGFTAATGGGDDNQDILSWTFSPNTQSAVTSTGTTGVINFAGGIGNGNTGSDFTSLLTPGGVTSATFSVNPIPISQSACNKIVQKTFPLTQCIVYENTGNGQPGSMLYSLLCPSLLDGTCGTPSDEDFFALLGTDLQLEYSENPGLQLLVSTVGPYLGVLKGVGPNALTPCAGLTQFASNQIVFGSVGGDTLGSTHAMSGGGGSCWVVTYFTHGEVPPGIKVTAPTSTTTYPPLTSETATYTCSNPSTSQLSTSSVGPYQTVASCTASVPGASLVSQSCTPTPTAVPPGPGGTLTCTATFVTPNPKKAQSYLFTVTAVDSVGDLNVYLVVYKVS